MEPETHAMIQSTGISQAFPRRSELLTPEEYEMEPETITITISPVDGKYKFAMNGVQAPQLHDSMGAAARSAWLTIAAAETVVSSGPEGDRIEPVGLAIIMKAILGICFDHLKEQIQNASIEERLSAGGRVKALLAARRIPSDDLTKLQDLFRTSTTP